MAQTQLSDQQIKDLMQKPKPTEQSLKLVESKTKLVAINEMRRQVGLNTVDKLDEITLQDKRGWLVLQDLWRESITKDRANELLKEIYGDKNDQTMDD